MRVFFSLLFGVAAMFALTLCLLSGLHALEPRPVIETAGTVSMAAGMLSLVFAYLSALLGYETEVEK